MAKHNPENIPGNLLLPSNRELTKAVKTKGYIQEGVVCPYIDKVNRILWDFFTGFKFRQYEFK